MQRVNFRYKHLGTQYQFSVAAPYTQGHCLTEAEAQALNQLRLENIRENMRPRFSRAVEQEAPEGLLDDETIAAVQEEIDLYDQAYQFLLKPEPAPRLGAIEREAQVLARARLPDQATEEEIELLAQSIDLVVEARKRVEARNRISATTLEDLLR